MISQFGIFVNPRYHPKRMEKSIYRQDQEALQGLLRTLRADSGLRQVDLADALGQPQSFVSKYESGERRLDVLELRQVCRVLRIPLGEFVRLLEDKLGDA